MSSSTVSPIPPRRIRFVDVYRGLAILMMIEAHVVNAFLLPALRESTWFSVLDFANGVVAPSFLFISGFAFALTADRMSVLHHGASSAKGDDLLHLRRPLLHYLRRIVLILLLGYALHLPFFSFRKLIQNSSTNEMLAFYQSDILQCIGISLLILLLMLFITRTRLYFCLAVGFLAIVTVLATPLIWESRMVMKLPPVLAEYLTPKYRSIFPLLPWSAFLFVGSIVGFHYLEAKREGMERRFMRRLVQLGAGGITLGMFFRWSGINVALGSTSWKGSLGFMLLHLGLIMTLAVALWAVVERRQKYAAALEIAGQESLFIYMTHLVILYGSAFTGSGISQVIGMKLSIAQCLLGAAVLIMAMSGVAWLWHTLKRSMPIVFRTVQYSFSFVILYLFFTRPF
ncbi:MAG: heparan-alpha-glucosaminide N-acetyltransferase domain-containing protein [Bacteroidota bacterium]